MYSFEYCAGFVTENDKASSVVCFKVVGRHLPSNVWRVHVCIARHLVAITSDIPSEHHSKVCKRVRILKGILNKPEAIYLAAFNRTSGYPVAPYA